MHPTKGALMIAGGVVLILVGFVLAIPRGALAGSTSHRVTRTNLGLYDAGEAPRERSRRNTLIRVAIGLSFLAGGFAMVSLAPGGN